MKGRRRKQRFSFKGTIHDDSILIGSHGDATLVVEGKFDLAGIIYCPKYTVTITIKGDGNITFRGKCHGIIIRQVAGNCTLDLSDLTCREFRCESLRKQAVVILGKTRVITQATLADNAELHISEKPLIISSTVSGNARIVYTSLGEMNLTTCDPSH
jgi:hypothetical protein